MSATLNIASATVDLLKRETESCVSATPDKNGHVPPGSCDAFYYYYPSFALAAVFTGIFLLLTALHFFQAFHYRKGFCWVLIMGTAWEFASFALRAISTKHQQKLFFVQTNYILFALAPLWINAFVYMCAGRMIFCFLPERKVFKVKATSIGRAFVLFDILSFLVQLGGASMTAPGGKNSKLQDIRLRVYQAGSALQLVFILIFLVVIVGFHTRMLALQRTGYRDPEQRSWQLLTWVLYFVLVLICVRLAYRLAEFLIGLDPDKNPLIAHEIYMYVLDAVPMAIATFALNLVHPGRILVGVGSNYRVEKKMWKAQQKAQKHMAGRKEIGQEEEELSMMGNAQHTGYTGHGGSAAYGGGEYAPVAAHPPPAPSASPAPQTYYGNSGI